MNSREEAIWNAAFGAAWVAEYTNHVEQFGVKSALDCTSSITEEAEAIAEECVEQYRVMGARNK